MPNARTTKMPIRPRIQAAATRRNALLLATALAAASGLVAYRIHADPLAQAAASLDRNDIPAAQLQVRTALKAHPDSAEAQWLMGRLATLVGNPELAERALRAAQAAGYDPAQVRAPLATALLAQNRPTQALALLSEGEDTSERRPHLLVLRAAALEGLHDTAAAYAALDEAARQAPKLAEIPVAAAGLALREKDYARASRFADRALTLDGRDAGALLVKAEVLTQQGQRAAALDMLTKAAAADPKAYKVRLERGHLLLAAGRTEDARREVAAVLDAEPGNHAALYMHAAMQAADGDDLAADRTLQRLSRHLAALPRGWYTLAAVKFRLEQFAQAADAIEKHLARTPLDPEGHTLQARIHLAQNEPGKALDALAPFLSEASADAEMLEVAATAQTMAHHLAGAEASLVRAATLAPASPSVNAHLGIVRLLAGDTAGALKALERSLTLAPTQPAVAEQLVVVSVSTGQPDRAAIALDRFRAAVGDTPDVGRLQAVLALGRLDVPAAAARLADLARANPGNPALSIYLAQVLLLQGRRDEAVQAILGVLARDPANQQALQIAVPVLERDGKPGRALAVLDAARRAAPADAGLMLAQSALLARARRWSEALAALDAAPAIADLEAVQLARATIHAELGHRDAVRQIFAVLQRRSPDTPSLAISYSGLLLRLDQANEARAQLATALAATPEDPALMHALVEVTFTASGLPAALATVDDLARHSADRTTVALLRGDALRMAGKMDAAADAYRAQLGESPGSTLALRATRALDASQGHAAAIRFLRGWVAQHDADGPALSTLAELHASARQPAEAAHVLERLMTQTPNDPVVANNLAWVYNELGDGRAYTLALRAYLTSFSPSAADTLGTILLDRNQVAQGLQMLRVAARDQPDNPAIRLRLAHATRLAGLPDETRVLLETLVQQPFDGRATAVQALADLNTAR